MMPPIAPSAALVAAGEVAGDVDGEIAGDNLGDIGNDPSGSASRAKVRRIVLSARRFQPRHLISTPRGLNKIRDELLVWKLLIASEALAYVYNCTLPLPSSVATVHLPSELGS
mmetsp:Transcript_46321/g.117632  ORF Transcript_46321/g.117632 Transcript_46321/m.117632 type:complete len:113 (+) Transcript_46321:252-590(+)